MKSARLALAAALTVAASPALAGLYKLAPAGQAARVGGGALTVTPSVDWNHMGRRLGRNAESWTEDGLTLDDVTFYAGIGADQTLFKERDKADKPLPRFNPTMLPTDVVQMFEESYRIANDTAVFNLDKVEPARFLGGDGFRFAYSFVVADQVERRGVGVAAIRDGKLYMITYEAPRIYYFDRWRDAYDKLADSAVMSPSK
jgi:hypothetical protein